MTEIVQLHFYSSCLLGMRGLTPQHEGVIGCFIDGIFYYQPVLLFLLFE